MVKNKTSDDQILGILLKKSKPAVLIETPFLLVFNENIFFFVASSCYNKPRSDFCYGMVISASLYTNEYFNIDEYV